jgi:hypothetical protein
MRILSLVLILPVFILSCSKSSTSYVNNPGSPDYLHTRPVGASANELLAADKYQSLKIEILYMPGFAPDPQAVEHLRSFLLALINKPTGVAIVTREIPASSKPSMTINDLIDVEKAQRTAFTAGSQIAVSIIYTNGTFANASTLGVAYRNTSVALFAKTINDNSGGIGQPSRTKLESTILAHEAGHLLGLVDLGSEMQTPHKDTDHGNHCNNNGCLMYYTAETTDILGFLLTGNIPTLDANCQTDLRENGGR